MRRILAAAALLALPVTLWAQTVTQNGQSTRGVQQGQLQGGLNYVDSTMVIPGVDPTTKGWYTQEQSPARNAIFTQQIINNASFVIGFADSSAVLDVHAYEHLKLLIHVTPLATKTAVVHFAVQIREHWNSQVDSSSTFTEIWAGNAPVTTAATAVADTAAVGHLFTGSNVLPWSGEFVVDYDPARASQPTGVVYAYPSGISVPLDRIFGTNHWFDKMSVRVRQMTGAACAVQVYVKGVGR